MRPSMCRCKAICMYKFVLVWIVQSWASCLLVGVCIECSGTIVMIVVSVWIRQCWLCAKLMSGLLGWFANFFLKFGLVEIETTVQLSFLMSLKILLFVFAKYGSMTKINVSTAGVCFLCFCVNWMCLYGGSYETFYSFWISFLNYWS